MVLILRCAVMLYITLKAQLCFSQAYLHTCHLVMTGQVKEGCT